MPGPRQWAPLILPLALSLVVGVVSAYVWTYGPSVIIEKELISTDHIGWLWLTAGIGGLFGVFTSQLVDRIGPLGAFLLSSAGIILAIAGIAVTATPWVAIGSLAVFGGQATAWLFLALAVGQAVGAVSIGST